MGICIWINEYVGYMYKLCICIYVYVICKKGIYIYVYVDIMICKARVYVYMYMLGICSECVGYTERGMSFWCLVGVVVGES